MQPNKLITAPTSLRLRIRKGRRLLGEWYVAAWIIRSFGMKESYGTDEDIAQNEAEKPIL